MNNPGSCFVPLIAHQGGWDEALMVAVPLVVVALALRLARRRAEARLADEHRRAEARLADEHRRAEARLADEPRPAADEQD